MTGEEEARQEVIGGRSCLSTLDCEHQFLTILVFYIFYNRIKSVTLIYVIYNQAMYM